MFIVNKVHKTDIFFDLDHTLWDFDTNSANAFGSVFDSCQVPFALEEFLHYYVPINEKYWLEYSLNQVSQQELRLGRLRDTFEALNFESDLSTLEMFSEAYIQELPKFNELFEGTVEILEYLKSKYKLHILTNGFHEVQEKKITNSKIHTYFQTITNSEMAGVKKPDPLIFEYALKQAGTTSDRSVMVGDNLVADIHGARAVGMDAIHFNPLKAEGASSEVLSISCLLDIKRYL